MDERRWATKIRLRGETSRESLLPMSSRDLLNSLWTAQTEEASGASRTHARGPSVVIAELAAIVDAGRVPLVVLSGPESGRAVRARSLIDLNSRHIGAEVAIAFEGGDEARPIIMGVLQDHPGWPLDDVPGQVDIEADGTRLVVSARQALVLRCGASSITLTADGRIEVRGDRILTQAVRANRIRGGSVELN